MLPNEYPFFDVSAHLEWQGERLKEIKLYLDFDFNPVLLLAESAVLRGRGQYSMRWSVAAASGWDRRVERGSGMHENSRSPGKDDYRVWP